MGVWNSEFTDGGHVMLVELVFLISEEDAGFSDARVTDYHEFYHIVMIFLVNLYHSNLCVSCDYKIFINLKSLENTNMNILDLEIF